MEQKPAYPVLYTQPQGGVMGVPQQSGVVMGHQPGAKREWSFGLFDCFSDIGGCLCAYFCTCCYAYKVFTDAGEGFCDCCWGGILPLRVKVRTERGIEGSICKDVFAAGCCPICAMVQLSNEIKNTRPLV